MTKDKRILAALMIVALFACFGVYAAVMQGVTFYNDYQEFKAMRTWVRVKVATEQRAREAQSQRQPTPMPPPPPEPARQ